LSRLIVNLFEKRLNPWIYKITDSKSIVLKSTFQKIEKERDILSQKLESEREAKLRLQNEISGLEDRIKELINPIPVENTDIKLQKATVSEQNKIDAILKDIQDKNMTQFFDKLIDDINNQEYIDTKKHGEMINYFLKSDIIKLSNKHWNNDTLRSFIFTSFGEKLIEEFVINKINMK
jgi:hypothetical protein